MSESAAVLLQLSVIVTMARLAGWLMRKIGQPAIMGEMISGILLGPTLFGSLMPGVSGLIFSPRALIVLESLSTLGVVLFIFLTGLSFGTDHLRSKAQRAAAISVACMAIPFATGVIVARNLPSEFRGVLATPAGFAVFLGLALSITAFPVLARILYDQDAFGSNVGQLAISAAALGDVAAWIVLPLVLSYTTAGTAGTSVWRVAAGVVVYVLLALTAGTRLIRLLLRRAESPNAAITVALVVALVSAVVTDVLGVHAAFGAFVAGLAVPRSPKLIVGVRSAIEPLTMTLLIPLFFAVSGQQTNFAGLSSSVGWTCALLVVVATAGKMIPAAVLGKVFGLSGHEALSLGALMNTRGLMEVVILRIGLSQKILSNEMFSVMIAMTVFTTLTGPPVLAWSQRQQSQRANAIRAGS